MTFRGDDRAVSTVVGAVLVFGILILSLGVYQAQIVPSENGQVEYRHSQTVQNQLQDLRDSLVGTAQTGDGAPVSVALGTRYPIRVFAVNPPPASGTIESVPLDDASRVRVENVTARDDETDDYLDGTVTFGTKGLAYEPDYNEFRNGPTTRYEYGTLYNDYEAGDINRTAGLLVEGDTITVLTLNASDSFSESGIDSVSVDPKALSAPHQPTEVENSGGTLTLRLPTNATEQFWQEQYADRPNVASVSVDEGANVATVTFADGQYDLRMAAVGVGSGLEEPGAHYLTLVAGDGTDEITVEARDRYNNPVSGVTVSASSPGSFEDGTIETGGDGRATFRHTGSSTRTVTFSIAGNTENYERVNAQVSPDDGGPAGPGGPFNVFWNATASNASDVTCYDANESCYAADSQIQLVADTDPTERGVPVEFETNDTVVDLTGSDTRTDGNGAATMELDTGETGGWIAAYVSSVGAGDKVRVNFNRPPSASFEAVRDNLTVDLDAGASNDPDGDSLTYQWDFGDGTTTQTTSPTTSHTYDSSGTYAVNLTVSDGRATDSEEQDVTVRAGGGGQSDPGFAYEDKDGDGFFERDDGDFRVDLAAENYDYDATSNDTSASLVVPESVTLDSGGAVSLTGENVTVRTDATAANGMTLTATQGTVSVDNSDLTSGNAMTLSASGGGVSFDGGRAESGGELTISGPEADISNAELASGGVLSVDVADLTVDTTTATDITGGISLGNDNGVVSVIDSEFANTDYGEATVSGTETTVSGTSLTAIGAISVTASSGPVSVTDSTLDTSTNNYGGVVVSGTETSVAGTEIDAVESVSVTATSGPLNANSANIDNTYQYAADLSLSSSGEMDLRSARLVSGGSMTGQRGGGGNTVYVADAVFVDETGAGTEFDVSPGSGNIQGTPQTGTVV